MSIFFTKRFLLGKLTDVFTSPSFFVVDCFSHYIILRMVAEYSDSKTLDDLIEEYPRRTEFYRTRGTIKLFMDQYVSAAKDFSQALTEARSARRARVAEHKASGSSGGKKRKGPVKGDSVAQIEDVGSTFGGTELARRGEGGFSPLDLIPIHPLAEPSMPLPMEPQCYFLRASGYLMHAVWLIEEAALKLEGLNRASFMADGMEMRLVNLTEGLYGAVEVILFSSFLLTLVC